MISKVSSKGQITIPLDIRRRLGLEQGSQVEFLIQDGETLLRPARAKDDDPFSRYCGIMADRLPDSLDEILRNERELRGHPDEDVKPVRRRARK